MAKGDVVADHEELIRALYEPLWSAVEKRATSAAFTQPDASVSRTQVLPYDAIVAIFKADITGAAPVVATCSTSVGVVLKACADLPKAGLTVSVVEAPVEATERVTANPAHAEIRARSKAAPGIAVGLTRGMANAILKLAEVKMVQ
jgi:hypothetical protein